MVQEQNKRKMKSKMYERVKNLTKEEIIEVAYHCCGDSDNVEGDDFCEHKCPYLDVREEELHNPARFCRQWVMHDLIQLLTKNKSIEYIGKKFGLYERLELLEECPSKYILCYKNKETQLSEEIDTSAVAIFEKSINPDFTRTYVCIKNGNEMRDDIRKLIDKD